MMLPTPHTLRVLEATESTNAYGGTELTYSDTGLDLPAFVQPDDGAAEDNSGRVVTALVAFTRASVPITARVQFEGHTYEVRSTTRWATGAHSHWESRLRRVDG